MNGQEQYELIKECLRCEGRYTHRCDYGAPKDGTCIWYQQIMKDVDKLVSGYAKDMSFSQLEEAIREVIGEEKQHGTVRDIDYFGERGD